MTSSIPSGFSSEDLQKLLANAQQEAEAPTPEVDPKDSDYQQKIIACADEYIDRATNEIPDPMVHKMMLVLICENFIRFHNRAAQQMIADGQLESAEAWLRDAGKFQSMINILSTVICGTNDFTVSE